MTQFKLFFLVYHARVLELRTVPQRCLCLGSSICDGLDLPRKILLGLLVLLTLVCTVCFSNFVDRLRQSRESVWVSSLKGCSIFQGQFVLLAHTQLLISYLSACAFVCQVVEVEVVENRRRSCKTFVQERPLNRFSVPLALTEASQYNKKLVQKSYGSLKKPKIERRKGGRWRSGWGG